MAYWLVKSEPFKYSWEQFLKDKRTFWDGVRNYQARNNLQTMKKGDAVFFYHSNEGLNIVGIAKVVKEAYQDPTIDDQRWVVVDLQPVKSLNHPVTLSQMKAEKRLKDMGLIRQGRLSVSPITTEEWKVVLELSERNESAPEPKSEINKPAKPLKKASTTSRKIDKEKPATKKASKSKAKAS